MKVRTEEEIKSGISKCLRGNIVYNILYSAIPTTKLFKQFIIFSIFINSKVKDTGIPIHIWGEDNMG